MRKAMSAPLVTAAITALLAVSATAAAADRKVLMEYFNATW
jgi:hypothetical protein